jgi:hypothetical protein
LFLLLSLPLFLLFSFLLLLFLLQKTDSGKVDFPRSQQISVLAEKPLYYLKIVY